MQKPLCLSLCKKIKRSLSAKKTIVGTKNVASNIGNKAYQAGEAVVDGTKSAVNTTIETTGKVAQSTYDQTGKAISAAADKTSEVAQNVADGTKNVASNVYDGTKHAAETVYDGTKNLAAAGVEKTGQALEGITNQKFEPFILRETKMRNWLWKCDTNNFIIWLNWNESSNNLDCNFALK